MSPLQFVVVIYLYIGRPILGYEFEGINPETVELRQSELLQYVQIENAKKNTNFISGQISALVQFFQMQQYKEEILWHTKKIQEVPAKMIGALLSWFEKMGGGLIRK